MTSWANHASLSATLLLSLMVVGCGDLLDVDLPGQVEEADLGDPGLAATLRDSFIGELECAWDSYTAGAAVHSDQYIQASGNANQARQALRDISADLPVYAEDPCSSSYGIFTAMHVARFQAESNFDRIQAFSDADVPNKMQYLAEARAYGAFTYVAFGEGFCGTSLDGQDQILSSEELLGIAVEQFTEALQLARAANLEHIEHMALVGRARAFLGMQRYAEAIADAELVPEGFRINATREAAPGRRTNKHFLQANEVLTRRHASIAPNYHDLEWKGVPDRRVNVSYHGIIGHDNATQIFHHDKYTSRADDILLADYREAQMFIAEAAALSGDLDRARSILNDFHERAGLPPVTEADTPTQDDVIRHVIEERRREFFVEGAHRLRDHVRWRGTQFEVPFLGEPGSIHPNGVDQYGQSYGTTTCYPVAEIEVTGSQG